MVIAIGDCYWLHLLVYGDRYQRQPVAIAVYRGSYAKTWRGPPGALCKLKRKSSRAENSQFTCRLWLQSPITTQFSCQLSRDHLCGLSFSCVTVSDLKCELYSLVIKCLPSNQITIWDLLLMAQCWLLPANQNTAFVSHLRFLRVSHWLCYCKQTVNRQLTTWNVHSTLGVCSSLF